MKKLFRSKYLITCNSSHDVFEDAFLAIDADRIIGVGPWKERPRSKAFQIQDCRYGIVTPGLFNLHSHLAMTLFKGVAEDVDLDVWLNKFIFPMERKLVSPEMVQIGTELALAECTRAGITYVADMYFYAIDTLKVYERSGLRATLGASYFEEGGMDYASLEESFVHAKKLAKKLAKHPRLQMALAPHAPYTCTLNTLKKSAALAKELNCGVMIHVSETQKEFHDLKRQTGRTPVELIADSGLIESKFLLMAHMVWLDETDYRIIDRSNITSVLNLQCNAKLASGYPKIGKFVNSKLRFALGSDGSASNNTIDMFSEINFASKVHHLCEKDLTGLPCEKLFDAVTRDAAAAVGLQDQLGSLEEGKQADFIVIDTRKPHLEPIYDPYHLLIYNIKASDVESVYVAGKCLMKGRRLLKLSDKQAIERANKFFDKKVRPLVSELG